MIRGRNFQYSYDAEGVHKYISPQNAPCSTPKTEGLSLRWIFTNLSTSHLPILVLYFRVFVRCARFSYVHDSKRSSIRKSGSVVRIRFATPFYSVFALISRTETCIRLLRTSLERSLLSAHWQLVQLDFGMETRESVGDPYTVFGRPPSLTSPQSQPRLKEA